MDIQYLVSLTFILQYVKGEIFLTPDDQEEVQLSIQPEPTITATYNQCLSSVPEFKAYYVTPVEYGVIYKIHSEAGIPIKNSTNECRSGQQKYYTNIDNIEFINHPLLVGRKFKLQVSIGNSEIKVSDKVFSFPAPLNLTVSSDYAVLNTSFTWTCGGVADRHIISWYRNDSYIGSMLSDENGTCAAEGFDVRYQYGCQRSPIAYTLTLLGQYMTKGEQGTFWRCIDEQGKSILGSRYIQLNIVEPPEAPSNVTVKCRNGTGEANISWVGNNNGGLEQKFEVLYRKEREPKFTVYESETTDSQGKSFLNATIAGLVPSAKYQFKVVAKSSCCSSAYSDVITCPTDDPDNYTRDTDMIVVIAVIAYAGFAVIMITVMAFVLKQERCNFKDYKDSQNKETRECCEGCEDIQPPPEGIVQDNDSETGSSTNIPDARQTPQYENIDVYEPLKSDRDSHVYNSLSKDSGQRVCAEVL